jgi:hypothetical protein
VSKHILIILMCMCSFVTLKADSTQNEALMENADDLQGEGAFTPPSPIPPLPKPLTKADSSKADSSKADSSKADSSKADAPKNDEASPKKKEVKKHKPPREGELPAKKPMKKREKDPKETKPSAPSKPAPQEATAPEEETGEEEYATSKAAPKATSAPQDAQNTQGAKAPEAPSAQAPEGGKVLPPGQMPHTGDQAPQATKMHSIKEGEPASENDISIQEKHKTNPSKMDALEVKAPPLLSEKEASDKVSFQTQGQGFLWFGVTFVLLLFVLFILS